MKINEAFSKIYKLFFPELGRITIWYIRYVSFDYGIKYFINYLLEKGILILDSLIKKPKKYTCICCGIKLSRFVNFIGYDFLPDSLRCPQCSSFPRHRFLHVFMQKNILPYYKHPVLLRYSPEPFFTSFMAKYPDVQYFGTDIKEKEDMKISFISDAQKIPMSNGSVDILISIHVLEHLSDDILALEEISRVLSQSGIAILMVPQFPIPKTIEFSYAHPGEHYHFRRYGEDFICRVKKAMGIYVHTIEAERYFGYHSDEYSSEKIYVCIKEPKNMPPHFMKLLNEFMQK